jgi:hypothetical protein
MHLSLCSLINDVACTFDCTVSNGCMMVKNGWEWIYKICTCHDLSWHLPWGTKENLKISVKLVCVLAEIQIRHLLNIAGSASIKYWSKNWGVPQLHIYSKTAYDSGARDSVVVDALCYKLEGRRIESRWGGFFLIYLILLAALWPWGRL